MHHWTFTKFKKKGHYLLKVLAIMRSALFYDVTQRWLAVCYQRSGTAYRSHLTDCLTLEDEIDGLHPNNSNCQSTLRNIAKVQRPHLYGGGSPKSRCVLIIMPVTIRTKNIRKTTRNLRKTYAVFFFQAICFCVFVSDFTLFSRGITKKCMCTARKT